jgi:hypothetical protein
MRCEIFLPSAVSFHNAEFSIAEIAAERRAVAVSMTGGMSGGRQSLVIDQSKFLAHITTRPQSIGVLTDNYAVAGIDRTKQRGGRRRLA